MHKLNIIKQIFLLATYVSNLIGTTIILLILGHFLIGFAIHVKHSVWDITTKSVSGDKREILPVYTNYPENIAFWKEHLKARNTHFEPYYHWRSDEFRGDFINVSNTGMRQTVKKNIGNNAKKVFIFGGSTIWGTGSKDEHTIPSFLQSMLGNNYEVYNFGETGFVSTQELNLLLQQLSLGNIPEIVIFYDGVNDGYAGAYSPGIPRDVQNLRARYKREKNTNLLLELYAASNYRKLIGFISPRNVYNQWDKKVAPQIKRNSLAIVEQYESHIRNVKSLGNEYGFQSFFLWQPNLFSKTRNSFQYENTIFQEASSAFIESQHQVYLDAKTTFSNREEEHIFFLGDIFNETIEPIYIDWCHIGPNGNKLVAKHIYNSVISAF